MTLEEVVKVILPTGNHARRLSWLPNQSISVSVINTKQQLFFTQVQSDGNAITCLWYPQSTSSSIISLPSIEDKNADDWVVISKEQAFTWNNPYKYKGVFLEDILKIKPIEFTDTEKNTIQYLKIIQNQLRTSMIRRGCR